MRTATGRQLASWCGSERKSDVWWQSKRALTEAESKQTKGPANSRWEAMGTRHTHAWRPTNMVWCCNIFGGIPSHPAIILHDSLQYGQQQNTEISLETLTVCRRWQASGNIVRGILLRPIDPLAMPFANVGYLKGWPHDNYSSYEPFLNLLYDPTESP